MDLRTAGLTVAGTLLVLVGTVLLVLPGPGLLLIAAGLTVLARRFSWAEDLLARTRARMSRRRTPTPPSPHEPATVSADDESFLPAA